LLESAGHSPIVSFPDRLIAFIIAAAAKSHDSKPAYALMDGTNHDKDNQSFTRTTKIYSDAKSRDSDYDSDTFEDARDTQCSCSTSGACGRPCKCKGSDTRKDDDTQGRSCGETCSCASECRCDIGCACGQTSCTCSKPCHYVAKDTVDAIKDELEVDDRDPYGSWASGLASIGSMTTTYEFDVQYEDDYDYDCEPSSTTLDEDDNDSGSTHSEPGVTIDGGEFEGKSLRRSTTLPTVL
jgi:hypothetical protein